VGGGEVRTIRGGASWVATDEWGGFEAYLLAIPGPSTAGLFFEVAKPGFGTERVHWVEPHARALEESGGVDGLVVVLEPSAEVRGRVLDPDGLPVPWATVRLVEGRSGDRNPSWVRDARTDAEGWYRFADLAPQDDFHLVADRELLTSNYVPLAGRLAPGKIAELDIPFPPDREIELQVAVGGWQPGISVMIDCIGFALDGPVLQRSEHAGPHSLTLYDAAEHPIAWAEFEIHYAAVTWRVEMEVESCEKCANPAGERFHPDESATEER
jgi:hypothetical protein